MNSEFVTHEQIDELLRFLPLLDVPERSFFRGGAGSEKAESGAITTPYPVYADDVIEFFLLAGQVCWSDFRYDPREAARMLEDDAFVERATLEEVKTVLTYCMRGERFTDGFRGSVLRSGKVAAVLRRLAVLRESMNASGSESTPPG